MRRQLRHVDAAQIEALRARQHRHRHLADLGRREDELDVLARLFERLQERVEGALRQHVHFVDDEHPRTGYRGSVLSDTYNFAYVVDAGIGGGIQLHDVEMAALHDLGAVAAEHRHVERGRLGRIGLVVERAGDDARRRRLADAAHAGEHVGLRDAPRRERVAQRLDHGLLADEVVEALRPVLARQHDVRLRRVAFGAGRFVAVGFLFRHDPAVGPQGLGPQAGPALSAADLACERSAAPPRRAPHRATAMRIAPVSELR